MRVLVQFRSPPQVHAALLAGESMPAFAAEAAEAAEAGGAGPIAGFSLDAGFTPVQVPTPRAARQGVSPFRFSQPVSFSTAPADATWSEGRSPTTPRRSATPSPRRTPFPRWWAGRSGRRLAVCRHGPPRSWRRPGPPRPRSKTSRKPASASRPGALGGGWPAPPRPWPRSPPRPRGRWRWGSARAGLAGRPGAAAGPTRRPRPGQAWTAPTAPRPGRPATSAAQCAGPHWSPHQSPSWSLPHAAHHRHRHLPSVADHRPVSPASVPVTLRTTDLPKASGFAHRHDRTALVAVQAMAGVAVGRITMRRHSLSRLWVPRSSFHSAAYAAQAQAVAVQQHAQHRLGVVGGMAVPVSGRGAGVQPAVRQADRRWSWSPGVGRWAGGGELHRLLTRRGSQRC